IKAKICRKDSLRGPVEFQTRRGLQSAPKLTRSKDGSEMEFSGRYRRAPASQAAAWWECGTAARGEMGEKAGLIRCYWSRRRLTLKMICARTNCRRVVSIQNRKAGNC